MPTQTTDVDMPDPKRKKKDEFAGFRLDADTLAALDVLARGTGGNKSEALRNLIQKTVVLPKERTSAL